MEKWLLGLTLEAALNADLRESTVILQREGPHKRQHAVANHRAPFGYASHHVVVLLDPLGLSRITVEFQVNLRLTFADVGGGRDRNEGAEQQGTRQHGEAEGKDHPGDLARNRRAVQAIDCFFERVFKDCRSLT